MVAGMEPDLEVQEWLEEEEAKRRAKEEAEGKGETVVIYDPGTSEVPGWGRRVLVIVVLAIVLVPLLWFVVIPRADAELVIQYHEGAVGGISVDARIENHGTRSMNDVQLRITVQDSGDIRMAEPATFEGIVSAHGEAPMEAIAFTGDQWETYHIFVEWSFECAGDTFTGTEHYDTEGTEMNVWFHHDLTA
jgi:hypothetical protein